VGRLERLAGGRLSVNFAETPVRVLALAGSQSRQILQFLQTARDGAKGNAGKIIESGFERHFPNSRYAFGKFNRIAIFVRRLFRANIITEQASLQYGVLTVKKTVLLVAFALLLGSVSAFPKTSAEWPLCPPGVKCGSSTN